MTSEPIVGKEQIFRPFPKQRRNGEQKGGHLHRLPFFVWTFIGIFFFFFACRPHIKLILDP